MAFTGIGKLIKDLVTGTPADTDYFAFGNTDLKKVSFPNLKKALGIDALNSAFENGSLSCGMDIHSINVSRYCKAGNVVVVFVSLKVKNVVNKGTEVSLTGNPAPVSTQDFALVGRNGGDVINVSVQNGKVIFATTKDYTKDSWIRFSATYIGQ